MKKNPISHAFATLPYLWIIIMALFVLLAYYNTRHSRKGYRYGTYGIIIGSVLASVIVGAIMYSFGFAPYVEKFIGERLPGYEKLMHSREEVWKNPEGGFIAGEVIEVFYEDDLFELKDLESKVWTIRPAGEYYLPIHSTIEEGVLVRIYGEKTDEELFEAYKVLPYQVGPGYKVHPFPGVPKPNGYFMK
jgi:hypothetical protein